MYRLFHEFAHRYDLHTPPGHYQHDHAFVIREALRVAPTSCRLLDIGCGTGVFLEAAIAAGIDGHGIDAAPEMIDVARRRLGNDRVEVQRMQDITGEEAYDVVCSLSWTVHYCETEAELENLVNSCYRLLQAGGLLVLQVANDEVMTGSVNIECEPGPLGEPDDTILIHRFHPLRGAKHSVLAEYVYASRTHDELLSEQHELRFANAALIADAARRAGFQAVNVINPISVSPFVVGMTD